MAGSHEDAMLMVERSKLGAMMGLDEASRDLFADDFDPDTAEVSNPSVQRILFFYETIGTLVKNGLLDRDLVYDWVWAEGVWKKVGPAAERAREQADRKSTRLNSSHTVISYAVFCLKKKKKKKNKQNNKNEIKQSQNSATAKAVAHRATE